MIDPAFFRNPPTLTTANLRLVSLGPEHAEGAAATRHDPETRRMAGTHAHFSEADIAAWLAYVRDAPDRADWAILRNEDDVYVGEVMLRDVDPYNESADFHIELSNSRLFGNGYGSEATKAVIDFGVDVVHLHRITLRVVDYNTRAQRLYSKVGFHPEGVLRDAWSWDGEWSDVILMALVSGH
jgi:RimJ/RimL family protein N-acetyltransferase